MRLPKWTGVSASTLIGFILLVLALLMFRLEKRPTLLESKPRLINSRGSPDEEAVRQMVRKLLAEEPRKDK